MKRESKAIRHSKLIMKQNFILIDHSIVDSTGHHLEYARRVLGAAKKAGYRTVLAANIRSDNVKCNEVDCIESVFTNNYWKNQSVRPFQLLTNYMAEDFAITRVNSRSAQFAKELNILIKRINANQDDYIFIPTLGETELLGIAIYSELDEAEALNWHLLFRRDWPRPTGVLDIKTFIKRKYAMETFKKYANEFLKGVSYFYTDTEDLSDEYNRQCPQTFHTLPIPLDDYVDLKKCKSKGPLVISYLGDAREEKGVHLLPNIIREIRKSGFCKAKVRFRIQANFPLTGNTKIAIHAKKELIGQQDDGVEVLEGPFDTDTYHSMVTTSDIILIPYNPDQYKARSSGIFAEALAAGVPTVFPLGTWMEKWHQGSGSMGFNTIDEISIVLKRLLESYKECELKSNIFSRDWRERHSARRLISILEGRVASHSDDKFYSHVEKIDTISRAVNDNN